MNNKLRLALVFLLCTPSLLFAADRLVFAVDIIRHGDRTPIGLLPAVNFQWKEGLGQLTAEGMRQEYEMGVRFRKRYVEQTHLLPEHYAAGTLYVRSTNYDRTLMSAESLLMGLYPPGTGPDTSEPAKPALPHAFQPIPVFSAPSQYDDVIIKNIDNSERTKLMQRYVYSTREWQQKNNELQPKFATWSRLTGVNIKSLNDLIMVGDTLYIHQVHKAPMPPGLSARDIETIINASDWVFAAAERPPQVAAVYSTQLMTNIANYLQKGSQETSRLKYVLLSAHDTTIASALSYMGAPLNTSPPYASNLNFSLYASGPNHYTVKITYNGSPVPIPACGGTVCDLEQFVELAKGFK
ncbi:hypothetical protein AQUSIP_07500 [Aquicella siphonis]|uniref:Periplasmic AppA protein n=1 Tax=Aquicella siphonis TaxID=254247 RepID=A0A5E4PEQ6_9COXI|nr:histidine phosphatase family protein [Aquicella siphonis]VVC75460.1 hypothetical protein AQUSIP_07500 [Aquicella siphonis]